MARRIFSPSLVVPPLSDSRGRMAEPNFDPTQRSQPARRGGRPSKLTDELENNLCRHLSVGVSIADAAVVVGTSPSTVHGWLTEGRRSDGRARLRELAAAVDEARSESTLFALSAIQQAMRAGKWRAAAYFLERRFPGPWRLEWRYDRLGLPRYRQITGCPRPPGACAVSGTAPPRLTREVQAKVSIAFRAGAFPQQAAAYAGISRSTLYRWRAEARHPEAHPRLRDFVAEINRSEAQAELEAVKTIRRAGLNGQWRAGGWMLERLEPEEFGPVDRFGRRPTNPLPAQEQDAQGLALVARQS